MKDPTVAAQEMAAKIHENISRYSPQELRLLNAQLKDFYEMTRSTPATFQTMLADLATFGFLCALASYPGSLPFTKEPNS